MTWPTHRHSTARWHLQVRWHLRAPAFTCASRALAFTCTGIHVRSTVLIGGTLTTHAQHNQHTRATYSQPTRNTHNTRTTPGHFHSHNHTSRITDIPAHVPLSRKLARHVCTARDSAADANARGRLSDLRTPSIKLLSATSYCPPNLLHVHPSDLLLLRDNIDTAPFTLSVYELETLRRAVRTFPDHVPTRAFH